MHRRQARRMCRQTFYFLNIVGMGFVVGARGGTKQVPGAGRLHLGTLGTLA
jgi:hypothetical protein